MSNDKRKKTGGIQMIQGSLWKNIFLFSVPLMFSQVLEVMFNLSDVAVVGRFADYRALGSVGSTTLLVTLFTGFLIGMGSGVNVQTALGLGAGDEKAVDRTIHTSFLLCAFIGLLAGGICFFFADGMLTLMNTKEELIDGAILYLRIYAFGMPAMGIYNFGNGVMSASGDTKHPLLYLAIAGVINVILNLFFVIRCHMAAEGVALASAISQYLSAILILIHLMYRNEACKFRFARLRLSMDAAQNVLFIGIPAGIQNAIFAIANIFVQVGVNTFDAVTVSGNAAATNADSLIFNVMYAFYTGCTSFMGQNRGAGQRKRVLKSYFISLFYSSVAGALLGSLLFVFGRQFLGLFATERAVIDVGMQRIRIMCFSYAISAFMDCSIAASRGLGKSVAPTIIVILGSCVFRITWIYTIFAYFHTIPSLYLLYFFSWTITSAAEILYFVHTYRKMVREHQL
ncbi:MATE family efflux transporter [Anaerosacchariphilus sp. NSJ-68]|uniref:MATE family efflux transporter n=2 Tax=Lachnospiraceae TaxID=186803 RepID=A0A923L951_9FIRM|nr:MULTISPECIES: MATE family efflux transporter [Lachnospiraceae]MBC5658206.1 MATE family efflux transporter [Anaerosacchariphilus hominis]MBC5698588.1 MATE family efflux transporter [Roseburia difficilis]